MSERELTVVGIGASAGGLEALSDMFRACPYSTGLAFVVVQHLSPDYESSMVEILGRRTVLRVQDAKDGIALEPETIYFIQPATKLWFEGDLLRVEKRPRIKGVKLTIISEFFESLAAVHGARSVAVVLSGSGSDGAEGLESVKKAGGIVVVQEPTSAPFDGMPRAAIATDQADLILRPELMIQELMDLEQAGPWTYFGLDSEHGERTLNRITDKVRDYTGVDFRHYKASTLIRRIYRRMAAVGKRDPRKYADYLVEDRAEAHALFRDLLIGVTCFLRDPEAVSGLMQLVAGKLAELTKESHLRVWVAGCSTGEEAYTLSILILEAYRRKNVVPNLRMFATDIDARAIAHASRGIFGPEVEEVFTTEQLERYFERRQDGYQVTKTLRETIIFSEHDVLEDPPFSRLDLVSCRNLLIYLKSGIQEKVLRRFSSSLNDGGLMWLGSSETVSDGLSSHFLCLSPKWKVYQARTGRRRNLALGLGHRAGRSHSGRVESSPFRDNLFGALEQTLAGYAPPSVIIDTDFRVLYRYGELQDVLRVPMGKASQDVRDMLPPGVAAFVSASVLKIVTGEKEDIVYRSLQVQTAKNETRIFHLRVKGVGILGSQSFLISLIFEDLHTESVEPEELPREVAESEVEVRIAVLRRELADTRTNLQETIEDLESSNEELQATNEELVASNEELQSTNEELQSVNEELHTVNSEHHLKMIELTELNEWLDGVMESLDLGVLILTNELNVERFNKHASEYVNLMPQDVGRPFTHLTHNLYFPDLVDRLGEVSRSNVRFQRQVKSRDGRSLLVRAFSLKREGFSSGLVVTMADITPLLLAENSTFQFKEAFNATTVGMAVLDEKGEVLEFNEAFSQIIDRDPEYLGQRNILDLAAQGEREAVTHILEAVSAGKRRSLLSRMSLPDHTLSWEFVDLIPSPPREEGFATILRLSRRLDQLMSTVMFPESEESPIFCIYDAESERLYPSAALARSWTPDEEGVSIDDYIHSLPEDEQEMVKGHFLMALKHQHNSTLELSLPDARPSPMRFELSYLRGRGGLEFVLARHGEGR